MDFSTKHYDGIRIFSSCVSYAPENQLVYRLGFSEARKTTQAQDMAKRGRDVHHIADHMKITVSEVKRLLEVVI